MYSFRCNSRDFAAQPYLLNRCSSVRHSPTSQARLRVLGPKYFEAVFHFRFQSVINNNNNQDLLDLALALKQATMAPAKRSAKDDSDSGPRKKTTTQRKKKDPPGYIPPPGASIPKPRVRKNGVATPTTIPQNVAAGASRQPSIVQSATSPSNGAIDLRQSSTASSAAKTAKPSTEKPAKAPYQRKSRAKSKPYQAPVETPTKPSSSASVAKTIPPSARKGATRSSVKPSPKIQSEVPVVEASKPPPKKAPSALDVRSRTQKPTSGPSTVQIQSLNSYGGSSNIFVQAQAKNVRSSSSNAFVKPSIKDPHSSPPAPTFQSPIQETVSSGTPIQLEKARKDKVAAEEAEIEFELQYADPVLNHLMTGIKKQVLTQPAFIQDGEGTVEYLKKKRLGELMNQATDGGTNNIFAVNGLGAKQRNSSPNPKQIQSQNVSRGPQNTNLTSSRPIPAQRTNSLPDPGQYQGQKADTGAQGAKMNSPAASQQTNVSPSTKRTSNSYGADRPLYRGMGLPPDLLTPRQIQNQINAQLATSIPNSSTSAQLMRGSTGPTDPTLVPGSHDQGLQQEGGLTSVMPQRRASGMSNGHHLKASFPILSSSSAPPISQSARVPNVQTVEGARPLQTPTAFKGLQTSGLPGISLHQQFLARTSGDHLFGLNFPLGKVEKSE